MHDPYAYLTEYDPFFMWNTQKVEGGFKWVVKKMIPTDEPVNGLYCLSVVVKEGIRPTRARAKTQALRWMRFYQSTMPGFSSQG